MLCQREMGFEPFVHIADACMMTRKKRIVETATCGVRRGEEHNSQQEDPRPRRRNDSEGEGREGATTHDFSVCCGLLAKLVL